MSQCIGKRQKGKESVKVKKGKNKVPRNLNLSTFSYTFFLKACNYKVQKVKSFKCKNIDKLSEAEA